MQSFRSRVFKEAYVLFREYGCSFGEALCMAWRLYRGDKQRTEHIQKRDLTKEQSQKIARNINAFDTLYQYIDDGNKWRFWDKLRDQLRKILDQLTDNAKAQVKALCEPQQAQYFRLY